MIEGYSIPIHRGLTEPLLMAGAPRGMRSQGAVPAVYM